MLVFVIWPRLLLSKPILSLCLSFSVNSAKDLRLAFPPSTETQTAVLTLSWTNGQLLRRFDVLQFSGEESLTSFSCILVEFTFHPGWSFIILIFFFIICSKLRFFNTFWKTSCSFAFGFYNISEACLFVCFILAHFFYHED